MSVLVRENPDKERVAIPVRLTAAFPVEVEALARTYRGVRVGEFVDLDPYRTVQRIAVDAARKWISHMALQGYDLMGSELDIRLWGPYRPKSRLYQSFGKETSATSYMDSEEPFPDGKAKMLLTGHFLARRQRMVEV